MDDDLTPRQYEDRIELNQTQPLVETGRVRRETRTMKTERVRLETRITVATQEEMTERMETGRVYRETQITKTELVGLETRTSTTIQEGTNELMETGRFQYTKRSLCRGKTQGGT